MIYRIPFTHQWADDPYAIQRERALRWLGDRYLLAQPITKPKLRSSTLDTRKHEDAHP